MSVLRYFVRNSFIRVASYAVGVAAAFMVTPHLLRSLGTDAYGLWSLISGLSSYYMLLSFGLGISASNAVARMEGQDDRAGAERVFTAAMCIGALSGLLAVLVAVVLALFAGNMNQQAVDAGGLGLSLFLFSVTFAVHLMLRSASGVLMGSMQWTLLALLGMLRTLISSGAVLVCIAPEHGPSANLLRVAVISGGAFALEGLLHLAFAVRRIPLRCGRVFFSPSEIKSLLRFGASVVVNQAGDLLRSRTQIYCVGFFLSVAHVTVYSLAQQFINYMSAGIMSAFGIMNPYFSRLHARGETGESEKALLMALSLSYAVSSMAALGLAFYGGAFVTRWLGAGYGMVETILLPMALAGIFAVGDMPASGYLIGLGRHSILAWLNIGEGVVNTLACIPVLLFFGLPGVAWLLFATTLVFRCWLLPRRVCAIAGIPLRVYFRNAGCTLLPVMGAQLGYYLAVSRWVAPDYGILAAAGAGQCALACLALRLVLPALGRAFHERQAACAPRSGRENLMEARGE